MARERGNINVGGIGNNHYTSPWQHDAHYATEYYRTAYPAYPPSYHPPRRPQPAYGAAYEYPSSPQHPPEAKPSPPQQQQQEEANQKPEGGKPEANQKPDPPATYHPPRKQPADGYPHPSPGWAGYPPCDEEYGYPPPQQPYGYPPRRGGGGGYHGGYPVQGYPPSSSPPHQGGHGGGHGYGGPHVGKGWLLPAAAGTLAYGAYHHYKHHGRHGGDYGGYGHGYGYGHHGKFKHGHHGKYKYYAHHDGEFGAKPPVAG